MDDRRSVYLQFVLYRGAKESYYRFYQNPDGTFARITTDIMGKSTWINFLSLSQVATQLHDAALMGYRVADLKAFAASRAVRLHDEIAKGVLKFAAKD